MTDTKYEEMYKIACEVRPRTKKPTFRVSLALATMYQRQHVLSAAAEASQQNLISAEAFQQNQGQSVQGVAGGHHQYQRQLVQSAATETFQQDRQNFKNMGQQWIPGMVQVALSPWLAHNLTLRILGNDSCIASSLLLPFFFRILNSFIRAHTRTLERHMPSAGLPSPTTMATSSCLSGQS